MSTRRASLCQLALLLACINTILGIPFDLGRQTDVLLAQEQLKELNDELDKSQLTEEIVLKFVNNNSNDTVVGINREIKLHCEAYGSPVPTIVWTKNGKIIQGSFDLPLVEKLRNIGNRVVSFNTIASDLYIPCASKLDAGSYSCITYNGHLQKERSIEVTVEGEGDEFCEETKLTVPRITQFTDSRFENENNAVQMNCRTNDKRAKVAWYNSNHELLNNQENFDVLSNGDLLIKKIDWELMGEYICVVSNGFGQDSRVGFMYPLAAENPL